MRNIIKITCAVFLIILISGCASNIKQQELNLVNTVGIVNEFPKYPNFVTIGTTIFTNDYDYIENDLFSDLLVSTVKEYVEGKGMKVSLIAESEIKNVDMALKLVPRDVYGIAGTYGYGINQKMFLGKPLPAMSYVALNLVPYINGNSRCSGCYLQSMKKIEVGKLPEKFSMLSSDDKILVESVLKENIKETVKKILVESGI
ncbi:hypothetical protein GCM10011352_01210 [Marinobacterium zhoushanense]|uniref:DUF4136 domain-containing protein n=1 Tax=Marinobacterium zhoushanense TaxID=1679163 RepID=A0ABQ1JZW4_9GAMM|nr:hypothetical protein [Marinobacterium zhoushanense]GGB79309.1 hypothetical protein GCM10011352_01210 [Marinobacterium zhoushanense]